MKKFDIFTDGSHLDKQHNGRLGVGAVLVDRDSGTPISEYSTELSKQYMEVKFGAKECSNPTAEMVAVLHALLHFKKELQGASEVTVYADFIGVKEWLEGNWKINEPYIRKIRDEIEGEIKKQGISGKIKFSWVKGHQTKKQARVDPYQAKWNDYVDKLAKGE